MNQLEIYVKLMLRIWRHCYKKNSNLKRLNFSILIVIFFSFNVKKVLEDKESQLSSLKSLEENAEAVKTFVGEVVAHGADLKFLTISGQKFIDISKVK